MDPDSDALPDPDPAEDRGDAMHDVLANAADSDRLEEQTTLAALEARMFGTKPVLQVARYALGERLGRGAAGDVYLARDPTLDRDVAVKLLRPEAGPRGARGRSRFLREARSIAALSHPNVVKVFDVGDFSWASLRASDDPPYTDEDEDEDRGVFIVMERIVGHDLAHWLTEKERSVTEILSRFLLAGEGLTAAHRHGVVHRDFKPSNVLVSRSGTVKVVDFGLALVYGAGSSDDADSEALSESDAHAPLEEGGRLTVPGTVLGTPLFMAPEQHRGDPADARADQYAFCASLFFALHGRPPFAGETLSELARAKHGGPPAPPAGSSVPPSVHRAIARGLRPDPSDRWPTMDALLHALRSRRRRAHPLLLAGVGATTVALVAIAVPMRDRPSRCDPQTRTTQVWSDARSERLARAFGDTDLSYADQTHEQLRVALDAHTQRWGEAYRQTCEDRALEDPARDLRMLCLLRQLEQLDAVLDVVSEADPSVVERSVGAVLGLPPPDECLDAGVMSAMVEPPADPASAGRVEQVRERMLELRALQRLGRYQAGMVMARGLAAEAERLGHAPLWAEVLAERGSLEERAGDYEAARETLEQAYFVAQPLPHHRVAARVATDLVWIYGHRLRRYDDADAWGRHAQAALEAMGTPAGPHADLLDMLAAVDILRGEPDVALERNLAALALNEEAEPLTRATSHNNVATALDALKRYSEALEQYEHALELRTTHLGADHPAVATVLYNIGNTHFKAGQPDESLAAHRRALAIRERTLGPDHPRTAHSLSNIAAILSGREQVAEASQMTRRALAIWEATYGPDHPHVIGALANLASFLHRDGDLAGARETYARLVTRARALDEPNPALLLHVLAEYARLLADLDEHPEAIALFEEGLALHAQTPGPHGTVGWLSLGLSRSLAATDGEPARIQELADRALVHYEAAGAPSHGGLEDARAWRAELENETTPGDAARAAARPPP